MDPSSGAASVAIKTFRDLIVWQKSMQLVMSVYHVSEHLPAVEKFGLGSQLRRSAVSVPANIAEGHERHSRGDFRRHVSIASGSLAELETHLEIGRRLGYVETASLEEAQLLTTEVGRMLSTLLRRLRT
jgi:four helix bundle protein